MDAVNELSCEFAASLLTKLRANNRIKPDEAVSLIRNFYAALSPLMHEINRANEKGLRLTATKPLSNEQSAGH